MQKTVILAGKNKIQRDLEYIFNFNVECYLIDEKEEKSADTDIYLKEYTKKYNLEIPIIICFDESKNPYEIFLANLGYERYKDYYFASDILKYVNKIWSKSINKEIAVWGTGFYAHEFLKIIDSWRNPAKIDFFIDNNPKKTMGNYKVLLPEEIEIWKNYYIIIAVKNDYNEIRRQLEGYGLTCGVDFDSCFNICEDLEPMLSKTIFASEKLDKYCNKPLGRCEMVGDKLYLCCPDAMPSVGNITESSFYDTWHSMKSKIIRLSVVNKTFSFCNLDNCKERLNNANDKIIDGKYLHSEFNYPELIFMGFDNSCNLSCPSCREELSCAYGKEREEIENKADYYLREILPYCNEVVFAGLGEVFYSPTYRRMLKKLPEIGKRNLKIWTNGTLFTPQNWKLIDGKFSDIRVTMSIDGIRQETFEYLRRGASIDKIYENVEFAGRLRKSDKLKGLYAYCVLQEKNVYEMQELVDWLCKNEFDYIQFAKIDNSFHVYSDSEFEKNSIFDHNGNIKKKYLKYFTKELMDNPHVLWGNCFKDKKVDLEEDNYFYFPKNSVGEKSTY